MGILNVREHLGRVVGGYIFFLTNMVCFVKVLEDKEDGYAITHRYRP